MTRVNAGIPPVVLCDEHLISEYREIGRIGTGFAYRVNNGMSFDDIPESFWLGKGHMTFFFNKGRFIRNRFKAIKAEGSLRNFNFQYDFRNPWKDLGHADMYLDYIPTPECVAALVERITKQLPSHPRHYGVVVPRDYLVTKLELLKEKTS